MFKKRVGADRCEADNESVRNDRNRMIGQLRDEVRHASGFHAQFCTDACLRRFLDAHKWNVKESKTMLEATLKWRSTYKPERISWSEVESEGRTGKAYRASFQDRLGRTVVILRPGCQNTSVVHNQIRHLVHLLENATLNLPDNQEQMVWLIDFTGWSIKKSTSCSLAARDAVNVLQNHYPERLAVAFLYDPPFIFETFWKLVKGFLDAKTFAKVKFVYPKKADSLEQLKRHFDEEILPTNFGGKATHHYDHEQYSAAMVEDEKKAALFWGF